MPTLNWRGKDAVLNHHLAVPYHLLRCEPSMSAGEPGSGNLIVEGDNLTALKALLPYYKGQVKCIYIDPPYNTGNEGWVYNDNVNSPEMRGWLGKVVGGEAEDLSRHDKWLCMMWPRLKLLSEFLHEDGVIFISIDDQEAASLRIVCDEVFGKSSFVAQFVWKARQHLDSRAVSGVSTDHEYVLAYSRTKGRALAGKLRDEDKYANPDGDPRGPWMSRSILGLASKAQRPNLHYPLVDPATTLEYPCAENTGWRYSRDTMATKVAEGRILFPKKPTGRPREKVFLTELQTSSPGYPSVIDGIFTADGTAEIRAIFGRGVFDFPKPSTFVAELLAQAAGPNDLILDSFAGSGTTAHAVLKLNAEDGGNRRFILVEMDPTIAQTITSERVRRLAAGYTNSKGEAVPGLGGGFRYCRLGAPLFAAHGGLGSAVTREALAHHIYFTETGEPLPHPVPPTGTFIGACAGRSFHLLYDAENGVLVTEDVLATLPADQGHRVVFADACLVPEESLREQNVTFKQIPYAIKG